MAILSLIGWRKIHPRRCRILYPRSCLSQKSSGNSVLTDWRKSHSRRWRILNPRLCPSRESVDDSVLDILEKNLSQTVKNIQSTTMSERGEWNESTWRINKHTIRIRLGINSDFLSYLKSGPTLSTKSTSQAEVDRGIATGDYS